MRIFNTTGPVRCDEHYCLPPLTRLDLDEILFLIDQKKYFILHAPRQVGKTSYLLALRDYLIHKDQYHCLYINVEGAQAARENVRRGIRAILGELAVRARDSLKDSYPLEHWQDVFAQFGEDAALNVMLTDWAGAKSKPLVLLIDEIDSLVGDTLISVLRQLRAGYDKRPSLFPQSIILCGVRDLHDYRIHSSQEKALITGGSAFNIKAKSLRMVDFSQDEVDILLQQHTTETGQIFESHALELIWKLTRGQPWLVNALAYEVCFEMKEGRDRSKPITAEMVTEAKERIILRRETHIDQLVDKLQEERVRRVIEPILAGKRRPDLIPTDDIQYVRDLGLIRTEEGQLTIANPIYQEVIPRELTYSTQLTITHQPAWYIAPNGRLDVDKLLSAFQEFFREHSERWVERFDYKEAGPQLLLQAFLQRIVNRGGRVEREYGLGRRRTDLLVIWPYPSASSGQAPGGVQKSVLELKVLYRSLEATIEEGLEQTWAYMDRCDAEAGHLVIFDRAPNKSWDEKIFTRRESHEGVEIKVWGM
ncbi:MAG: ATP-binding protein [Anaerolineales bacterium]|nr:ATP-binding protein [Anaerolineales bacterium]